MIVILNISLTKYYKSKLNVGKLAILYHRIFLLINRKDYSLEHYTIMSFVFFLRGGGAGCKTVI
jgi:hypothetical protein